MQEIIEKEYWKDILERHSLLYLAHPLTSCGDVESNRRQEEIIAKQILLRYHHISLIRPLTILNPTLTSIEAQNIYQRLLCVSDGIILSGDWKNSRGCQHEFVLASQLRLPVFSAIIKLSDDEYISDTKAIDLGIDLSYWNPPYLESITYTETVTLHHNE